MTTTKPPSALPLDWAPPSNLVNVVRRAAGLTPVVCRICSSVLIGTEIPFGTCGQCGGRSIHPAVTI